jgi:hypothetical protein
MSGAGVRASIIAAHNHLLAERAHHLLVHTGAVSTENSAARPKPPAPQASSALQVQWTYPNSGTNLTGDATIGFVSMGFSQPLNLSTLNSTNVQLSYQPFGSSQYFPVPAFLGYNQGNRALVVTPGNFVFNNHVQPNGTYILGIGTGLKSTTGASLSGNYYFTYTDHSGWGQPGHYPISYASLPGNAPNDPFTISATTFSPGSGVIILDQYEQLDPASVNQSTVQLFHINPDGSFGARVPITMTYDAQIPSIYIVPNVALTIGKYRIAEFNTLNFAGNQQKVAAYLDFIVPQNDVPPGDNPSAPPNVNWTFPANNSVVTVTDFSSMGFNVPINTATLNASTILLQKNINGVWTTVPHAISYNPGTYVAYVTPTQGIQSQGSQYRLVVNATPIKNPIRGTNGLAMANKEFFNFTYNSPLPPFPPLIDAKHWESFPTPGSVVSNYPAAFLVILNKWNGYRGNSITNKTFQIYAVNGAGQRISGPLDNGRLQVAWNPRASYAVLTMPDDSLGDGRYIIVAQAANGQPGVGVVDLAGNVQKTSYVSGAFTITGTGRPQTTS